MQATALKDEAISLLDSLSAEQVRYVLGVIRSLPQEESAARKCSLRGRFASYADPALRAQEKDAWSRAAALAERDRRDIAWINANAERLNAEVEETLEFQADIWENEE